MTSKTRLAIGLGAGALIVGGFFVVAAFMGADQGSPCDPEWGCKGLNSMCLEGDGFDICANACASDSECPDGYGCETITVWTLDGKSAMPDESTDKACLPAAPP